MATRAHSSTSVSADATTNGRSDRTVRSHSGQGRTATNLLALAVCLLVMLGSFWAFASYPNSPLLWIIGLLLYGLALLIPVSLLRSSTATKAEGGRTLVMAVPPTTEVGGTVTTAQQFDDGPRNTAVRDAQVQAEHHDDKYGRATE